MGLPPIDRTIIQLLDYFGQLTSAQVRSLAFPEAKSRTSADNVLRRLVRGEYVHRIEQRRSIGGARGGSGEYVWTLGREGWHICGRDGRYRRQAAVNYHTLTIAEVYVRLREVERQGIVRVVGFMPEPEAWMQVEGEDIRPDLLVELERPVTGARLTSMLEIDMSTQRPARLHEKMDRYKRAHDKADMSEFPLVVFVCHGEVRRQEIAWLIERRNDEPPMFRVVTVDDYPVGLWS